MNKKFSLRQYVQFAIVRRFGTPSLRATLSTLFAFLFVINLTVAVVYAQNEHPAAVPQTTIAEPSEDEGLFSSILTNSSALVIAGAGLFGLFVVRKIRSRRAGENGGKGVVSEDKWTDNEASMDRDDAGHGWQNGEPRNSMVKASGPHSPNGSQNERKAAANAPVTTPASFYGAYRIDQEVGKLLLGQPHRMDVLSSRAPEDRRAIETSLTKVMTAPDADENQRRRAREALEEYGFVARQCASLLLAADAFERTSAARCLGEIRSASALQFLLEGLYDHESIVRNQAVVSLGELKLPSAIGALLDMARTHPDVPSTLLSRALSACSVEGLDFFDVGISQVPLLSSGQSESLIPEITHLEPASTVEDLPEASDDESVAKAISQLESANAAERAEAVQILGQFQVQSSVTALSLVVRRDSEPSIRALAISSLASINHESVFPAILVAMADESREVRAASARSLSRLSFDRIDAYVRVMETADEEMLREVVHACIQAGIVSQNIDRLASNDRRQAYEAYSLICLLAKAKMIEPILEAISNHPNMEVRVTAVQMLATTGQPQIFEELRQLAVKDGIAEEVKTALLEAMYKLEQAKSKETGDPVATWIGDDLRTADTEKHEIYSEPQFQEGLPLNASEFESESAQEPQLKLENSVDGVEF
jgi:HEAT repeat protein